MSDIEKVPEVKVANTQSSHSDTGIIALQFLGQNPKDFQLEEPLSSKEFQIVHVGILLAEELPSLDQYQAFLQGVGYAVLARRTLDNLPNNELDDFLKDVLN